MLGTGSYYDIVSAVGKVLAGELVSEFGDINAPQPEPQRILTTPEHYAYLRIAEGCDNHCAFCIIPQLRGRYRSRPMEELLKEAQDLADSGVKELIVIAQDTSRYGIDLYGERKLAELLQKLCAIDGFVWVRVHYLYPDEMSEELIDVLANEPTIVKYLDIPIQHINDNILRAMNRRGNGEYVKQLLKKLRARHLPRRRGARSAGVRRDCRKAFRRVRLRGAERSARVEQRRLQGLVLSALSPPRLYHRGRTRRKSAGIVPIAAAAAGKRTAARRSPFSMTRAKTPPENLAGCVFRYQPAAS